MGNDTCSTLLKSGNLASKWTAIDQWSWTRAANILCLSNAREYNTPTIWFCYELRNVHTIILHLSRLLNQRFHNKLKQTPKLTIINSNIHYAWERESRQKTQSDVENTQMSKSEWNVDALFRNYTNISNTDCLLYYCEKLMCLFNLYRL